MLGNGINGKYGCVLRVLLGDTLSLMEVLGVIDLDLVVSGDVNLVLFVKFDCEL